MREIVIPFGRTSHDTVTATQAPVPHDRSFLDASYDHWQRLGSVPDVTVPVTANYDPMSPVERSTGVVLPIVSGLNFGKTNRHHGHFFASVYNSGSEGQKAARASRLQRVPVGVHERYHQIFLGTQMPKTIADEYRLTILNCAGYVPDKAVFIDDEGQASVVRLTHEQRKVLRKPNVFTSETDNRAQSKIGQFLMYYALSQDLGRGKTEEIQKFLDITPEQMQKDRHQREKKLQLAMRLTNTAIAEAVKPISDEFTRARKQRALRFGAPKTAWHLVKDQLNHREPDYFETLEQNLLVQINKAA